MDPKKFLILVTLLSISTSLRIPLRFVDPVVMRHERMFADKLKSSNAVPEYKWKVGWYPNMPIDHFSYRTNQTFKLRYLYNLDNYKSRGPIFFYTGNEGYITDFAENTGIMWDLAPTFNAAIIFAEHRFYGETLPFGNNSYSSVSNLGYLDSQQALADYAVLITHLKKSVVKCDVSTPVIAFGGSYGGMLAAWFRMKYPQIVIGAWSSSAPLLYFLGGGVSPGAFAHVTTRTFVDSGCSKSAIANGFDGLFKLAETEEGRQYLNELFVVDQNSSIRKPSDADNLYNYIDNAIVYMAMTDYPYSANFLTYMPGWPVEYACQYANTSSNDPKILVKQLSDIANVYYNSSGKVTTTCLSEECTNTILGNVLGWPWQSCTEMVILQCEEGGNNDFFINMCGKTIDVQQLLEQNSEQCNETFGTIKYIPELMRPFSVPTEYGLTFSAQSNIVFTNGYLDPWSCAGVYTNTPGVQHAMDNGVYIFYMNDSAHHLDLRQPNSCDPPSVVNTRYQIANIMKCWISANCTTLPKYQPLPTNEGWQRPPQSTCKPLINQYPWNQTG